MFAVASYNIFMSALAVQQSENNNCKNIMYKIYILKEECVPVSFEFDIILLLTYSMYFETSASHTYWNIYSIKNLPHQKLKTFILFTHFTNFNTLQFASPTRSS